MSELVSNCCDAEMTEEMSLCPACFEGCGVVEIKEEE
jgi:hypothetical protein